MCFSYFESFLSWISVLIEAVDIETSLTILSDRYVIIDSYSSISAINLYNLSNFLGDKVYSITSFSIREKPEVTIVRLFYVDGSLSGGWNETGTVGVSQ